MLNLFAQCIHWWLKMWRLSLQLIKAPGKYFVHLVLIAGLLLPCHRLRVRLLLIIPNACVVDALAVKRKYKSWKVKVIALLATNIICKQIKYPGSNRLTSRSAMGRRISLWRGVNTLPWCLCHISATMLRFCSFIFIQSVQSTSATLRKFRKLKTSDRFYRKLSCSSKSEG